MDSAKKNISLKKALLQQKYENLEKNMLSNNYHSTLQTTYINNQIAKQSNGNHSIIEENDETIAMQLEIDALIYQCQLLDQAIAKNDDLQNSTLPDQLLECHTSQLDLIVSVLADKNQISSQLKHQYNQMSSFNQFYDIDLLIKSLKQGNLQDQQVLQKQTQTIQTMQEQDANQLKDILLLQQYLEKLKSEDQMLKQSMFLQSQSVKSKQFSVQIIQEQYYSLRRLTRSYCVFHSKQSAYDQNYEKYVKAKNSKQIQFDYNEQLRPEDGPLNAWWSGSKQKQKKCYPYRPNYYKFDFIYQRNQNIENSHYSQLFANLELFLKGLLYKSMDFIHKNLSFNSQEYQLIYNEDLNDNADKVRKMCERNVKDNMNNTIVILSDKNRGVINNLVKDSCQLLANFNNNIVQVNEIQLTLSRFQVKETTHEDIFECSYLQIEQFQQQLEEASLFNKHQFQIKIEFLVNQQYKRQLIIFALNPFLIDNCELFCRQFKANYKREKGFKEQLGTKIEMVIRNCDKIVLIVEIPQMIKMNGKHNQKLSKIKNIMEFYQQLVIRKVL